MIGLIDWQMVVVVLMNFDCVQVIEVMKYFLEVEVEVVVVEIIDLQNFDVVIIVEVFGQFYCIVLGYLLLVCGGCDIVVGLLEVIFGVEWVVIVLGRVGFVFLNLFFEFFGFVDLVQLVILFDGEFLQIVVLVFVYLLIDKVVVVLVVFFDLICMDVVYGIVMMGMVLQEVIVIVVDVFKF